MTGSGRRFCTLALAFGAALSVTSCGDTGSTGPGSLPAIGPPRPLSASLLPTPAPLSHDRTVTLSESAQAQRLVIRYYALASRLSTDMDANALAALFTPTCRCRALSRSVRLARAMGEHYIARFHLTAVTTAIKNPYSADVLVTFDASRDGLVDRHGHHVTSAPAVKNQSRDFVLVKVHGRWLINAMLIV
jgi:hypothetical protein